MNTVMLTKQQETDAVALVKMIRRRMDESNLETPEASYAINGLHSLTPRQKPRQFPIEVWQAVVEDFEKRGYATGIDARRMIFYVGSP